jgi:hypothetical protein
MVTERALQNMFRMKATESLKDVRLFVRSVGTFELSDGRVFRAGIKGQSDLIGIARGGLHIEIELKAEKGRFSPEQVAWRHFCQEWGVPWLLLQPLRGEAVEATMERWVGLVREIVEARAS